jgi:transcription factor IIIB subunit 2
MLKKNPRYSKRINYNALKDLLDSGSATGRPLEGDDLYTMEDKEEDGDVTVVIEDDMDKTDKTDEQPMEEDEDDYGVDKEEGYSGWEEGYEQEV